MMWRAAAAVALMVLAALPLSARALTPEGETSWEKCLPNRENVHPNDTVQERERKVGCNRRDDRIRAENQASFERSQRDYAARLEADRRDTEARARNWSEGPCAGRRGLPEICDPAQWHVIMLSQRSCLPMRAWWPGVSNPEQARRRMGPDAWIEPGTHRSTGQRYAVVSSSEKSFLLVPDWWACRRMPMASLR